MFIIEVEGLDKSGKHTQSTMLYEYLKHVGVNVEMMCFPNYDSPTGELIRKWLTNEWDVDKYTFELIMSADKQAEQKKIQDLEDSGVEVLIIDRYVGAQVSYALASDIDYKMIEVLQSQLRKPDLTIFLDVSVEESMRRRGKMGDNDRYESDKEFLNKVRNSYVEYLDTRELPKKYSLEVGNLKVKSPVIAIWGIDKLSKEEIFERIHAELTIRI